MKSISLILVAALLSSCSSTFEYRFSPEQYTTAAQNSAKEAKKNIAVTPNKIQSSGRVLLAPIVQAFEFDEFGPENDAAYYAWWNAGSNSAAFFQIQGEVYQKTFNRLGKTLNLLASNTNKPNFASTPKNPADKTFSFKPFVIAAPNYELALNNTDSIKSSTGASAVVYVVLHSIWSRDGYTFLYGADSINFKVVQWMRISVCTTNSNCLTTYVQQDNSPYAIWTPAPVYRNKSEYLQKVEKFGMDTYTNNVSEVIEAAVLSLIN